MSRRESSCKRQLVATLLGLWTFGLWIGSAPPASTEGFELEPLSPKEQQLVSDFRKLWFERGAVFENHFIGVQTLQNPFDMWIIQELIYEVKPDYVVEAGTYYGGSSVLWALFLTTVNPEGRVITIDIEDQRLPRAKDHPIAKKQVDFLLGSSTAPEIVAQVKERVKGKRTLFILDSLHTKEHVAKELEVYAPLVTPGSYIVVQDTPVGPIHAVREFVAKDDRFVSDRSRERFLITNSMEGYLKRVK